MALGSSSWRFGELLARCGMIGGEAKGLGGAQGGMVGWTGDTAFSCLY